MQTRSQTWQTLASTGRANMITRAKIGETYYSPMTAPVVSKGVFDDSPNVGRCGIASLSLVLLTNDTIPKAAKVEMEMRLSEGATASEWLPVGTFYVSQNTKDEATGLITLTCYDGLLRANQPADTAGDWPKTQVSEVAHIATLLEFELDSRTVLDDSIMMRKPSGLTMLAELGYIGACQGGNWIVTPNNKLRLVPLVSSPDAEATSDGVVNAILQRLDTGKEFTISGVTMTDGFGNTYTAGNDTGLNLQVKDIPYATQAVCDALYTRYNGLVYRPFTATQSIYDPAMEIGDTLKYGSKVASVLYSAREVYNTSFRGDISAPAGSDTNDEYPYISETQRKLEEARKAAEEAAAKAAEAAEAAEAVATDLEENYITETEIDQKIETVEGSITAEVSRVESTVNANTQSIIDQQSEISSLEVTAQGISTRVAAVEGLAETVEAHTQMIQDAASITVEIQSQVAGLDGEVADNSDALQTLQTWITTNADGLSIAKSDSPFSSLFTNSSVQFLDGGVVVAYINGQKYYIRVGEIIDKLIFRHGEDGEDAVSMFVDANGDFIVKGED